LLSWKALRRRRSSIWRRLRGISACRCGSWERVFKARTGHAPSKWLLEQQLQRALRAVTRGVMTKEAAEEAHFKRAGQFCRVCKKLRGCAPGTFHPSRKGAILSRNVHDVA